MFRWSQVCLVMYTHSARSARLSPCKCMQGCVPSTPRGRTHSNAPGLIRDRHVIVTHHRCHPLRASPAACSTPSLPAATTAQQRVRRRPGTHLLFLRASHRHLYSCCYHCRACVDHAKCGAGSGAPACALAPSLCASPAALTLVPDLQFGASQNVRPVQALFVKRSWQCGTQLQASR
jgi:hypothetical protein